MWETASEVRILPPPPVVLAVNIKTFGGRAKGSKPAIIYAMNKYLIIGAVVVLAIAGGWWYFSQSSALTNSETTQADVETANWKEFVNSRDGYSVRYPEDGGPPSIDYRSQLTGYGFETSVTFIRYGGWADIYIFDGSIDTAIAAHKKIDSEHRVYISTEDILIGGKKGKVVDWTNNLDPTARVSHSYFVEYRPGKTLYIAGSPGFVSTIKFL